MTTNEFSASALIQAPPARVYAIFADYHDAHPAILPKPPFVSLAVEQGGVGAGTVIQIKMRLFGQLQTFRSFVTEPEPGRVLVESNDTGYVTSFIVEPRGPHSYVTIRTQINQPTGWRSRFEAWLVARLLRPVYVRELANVAALATKQTNAQ